tara:strand:- start:427 stop:750 length:324 start_codon:yes stop_codon:yes gene_type:complete
MTLLRDVIDTESARILLGSYCFDRPCTIRLMSSNAPVHDGRESVYDVPVGVDNWYIDQYDLDAILDNDSQHDTGGYMDQYGFRERMRKSILEGMQESIDGAATELKW